MGRQSHLALAFAIVSILAGVPARTAYAVFITFNGVDVALNGNLLQFAAQNNPGGAAYDTTAGILRLDLTPGLPDRFGRPTTAIATLTLTGIDDKPFEVIYDPMGGAGTAVNIRFGSPRLANGFLTFDPVPDPLLFAHLDGTTTSNVGFNQGNGVTLAAWAFGSGHFGTIGPIDKAGPFQGNIGPIADARAVVRLRGDLNFDFAGMNAGDKVSLPRSAQVRAISRFQVVPEPGSLALTGVGGFLLLYRWRNARRA